MIYLKNVSSVSKNNDNWKQGGNVDKSIIFNNLHVKKCPRFRVSEKMREGGREMNFKLNLSLSLS
jgi:hypothetical protein